MEEHKIRLIDAEAFKRYVDCGHLRPPTEICFSEIDVVSMIDRQPAVDAVPVRHGRWLYDPDGMDFNLGAWVCSECKAKNDNLGGSKRSSKRINPYLFVGSRYCPNCGAKMDGEADATD